jgi:cytochrome c oxidase assembly protein subunit 15
MGGLVTTYDAGMAVPDWPNTYGYNLFLYPLESWLGVWDVFLEHSHRLIGASVGLISIALAVALWRWDGRKWMRWLGVAAVAGVSLQGLVGGLRVIGDELLLAEIHGCTAPLFFAFCGTLVTLTSNAWLDRDVQRAGGPARRLRWSAGVTSAAMYLQIVLGAQLRHVAPGAAVGWFKLWVWVHVIVAGLVLCGVLWLLLLVGRKLRERRMLAVRVRLLAGLYGIQLILGAATWVTNYGWPKWFTDYIWPLEYTVIAEGSLQAVTSTAHVAFGSLSLVAAWSLTMWSFLLTRSGPVARSSGRG